MTPALGEIRILPDAAALAEAGAALVAETVAAAAGRRCVIGLAGGSTPRPLYERLAEPPYRTSIAWPALDFVLGDERFVSPNDPDSNVGMIRAALFDRLTPPPRVHPVPFAGLTVQSAAIAYERTLHTIYGADRLDPMRPFFDLCLLGMGDDGHTASLLPSQRDLLEERTRWVVPVTKGRPEARVSLTFPVLDSARCVAVVVSGANKRAMLGAILDGRDREVPAARLRPQGRLLWLVDRAAAGDRAD